MIDQAEKLRKIVDNLKSKQEPDPESTNSGLNASGKKGSARIITITSGKGGVGKTNISINLAVTLSAMGLKVVILDADFGLANIDVLFGIATKYSLADVISGEKNILEVLTEGPNNIKFISGGSGVEDLVKLNDDQLLNFVNNIALLDKAFDVILIDTGAGLSESVMKFVMASDEVLIVTTPEPTSITDAYALIKMVCKKDKEKEIKVVINRAENGFEAEEVFNRLKLVSEKFLGLKLTSVGYVFKDDSVVKAVKQQQPFTISYPKSQASKSISQIAQKLIDNEYISASERSYGAKKFVSRLISLFR